MAYTESDFLSSHNHARYGSRLSRNAWAGSILKLGNARCQFVLEDMAEAGGIPMLALHIGIRQEGSICFRPLASLRKPLLPSDPPSLLQAGRKEAGAVWDRIVSECDPRDRLYVIRAVRTAESLGMVSCPSEGYSAAG